MGREAALRKAEEAQGWRFWQTSCLLFANTNPPPRRPNPPQVSDPSWGLECAPVGRGWGQAGDELDPDTICPS